MDLSREDFIAYTRDELSIDKKREIDLYLAANPLERKSLEGALDYTQRGSFENLIDNIDKKLPSIDVPLTKSRHQKLTSNTFKKSIPVILLIVILGALLVYLQRPAASEPALEYASYFEPYPDVVTSTVRGDVPMDAQYIMEAFQAYENHDYNKASTLFESLVTQNPIDERLQFYHAVSLTGSQQYREALGLWQKLLSNPGFPYMDGLKWNKALCHLGLNQHNEARKLLSEIVEEDLYKKNEAAILLSELD